MSLIGEFLYYWSYRHDILPCIVGSNGLSVKVFRFEQYTDKFSIFRKACLPDFGVTEYTIDDRSYPFGMIGSYLKINVLLGKEEAIDLCKWLFCLETIFVIIETIKSGKISWWSIWN